MTQQNAPSARVLLLTLGAGGGPIRAAEALAAAFAARRPDVQVRQQDLLRLPGSAALARQIDGEYRRIELEPEIWAANYELFNRPEAEIVLKPQTHLRLWWERLARLRMRRRLQPALTAMLHAEAWDLIVSTAAMPTHMVAGFKRGGQKLPPLHVVTTDFMAHRLDLIDHVDRFYAATAESAAFMTATENPAASVKVTGIPITPDFKNLPPAEACRRQLELAEDRPVVLLLSGGYGMSSTVSALTYILTVDQPLQIVVSAGHNQTLRQELEQVAVPPRHSVRVLGFTDKIATLMRAATVVVTKPGGLITAEALAAGAALAITRPLPGPEQYNRRYLLENGAGVNIEHLEVLPYKLTQLLQNPERLAQLRRCAAVLGKPMAADDIVRDLLTEMENHREQGDLA